MTNLRVAVQFVEHLWAGEVDGMALLVSDSFRMKGPTFEYPSMQAYLDSLGEIDPSPIEMKVLSATEYGDNVLLTYERFEAAGPVKIAQRFSFEDGKIDETLEY